MTASSPSSLKALIVSDSALAASAIRRCLRDASMRNVIGYVDASRPCGASVARFEPQVVIVDEGRSRDDALARIAEVRAALGDVKVLVLATEMDRDWLRRATDAGADAAIRKVPDSIGLGALVREVVAGNVFHPFSAPGPAEAAPVLTFPTLTSRELEILRLVARGASNSIIGAELWITEQTVKFHLSNVYRKLGVANRTQASRFAYENRLLELTPSAGIATSDASAPVSVAA